MPVFVDTDPAASMSLVDSDDAAAVERVAREVLEAGNGQVDSAETVAAAARGWDELPTALRRSLREFRRDSGGQGALLVRGLPVSEAELPPTPTAGGSVQRATTVPAALLMMIATGLGDPAAFHAEKSGALVQDVVPVPGHEAFQGNAGSVLLEFHNENAFHPHRPDFVMLLCLRPDHERIAGLRTACIRQAAPRLSEQSRETLHSEEFITQPPPSFGLDSQGTEPHAVLTGAPDDPDVRVDFAATLPQTDRAAAALAELQTAFGDTALTHRLLPGDLAIVDNRVTVHGRTRFEPRYDGADRWLQRSFVLADLRPSRGYRPSDGFVLHG